MADSSGEARCIVLDERDYMYGVGQLRMRTRVAGRVAGLPDEAWVRVIGTELNPDGGATGRRSVVVRVGALRLPSDTTIDTT